MSQFCPQCGTQNITEAKFCKSCGFNMQEAAGQLNAEKERVSSAEEDVTKNDYKHTSGSQFEMDHFFNGPQSENSKNSGDSQRVKEIDGALYDYKTRIEMSNDNIAFNKKVILWMVILLLLFAISLIFSM